MGEGRLRCDATCRGWMKKLEMETATATVTAELELELGGLDFLHVYCGALRCGRN